MDRLPSSDRPDQSAPCPDRPSPGELRALWLSGPLQAGLMCGPAVFIIGVVIAVYSAIHQGSIVGYTIRGDAVHPTYTHPEWEFMLLLGYALVAFGGLLTVVTIGTAITHRPRHRRPSSRR